MARRNGPKGNFPVRSAKMAAGYSATGPVGATGAVFEGEWEEKAEEMQWPDEICVDDLELVRKEWWLIGYWAKEMHPGWLDVFKEPDSPRKRPTVVAGYSKPWNGKKWKLEFPSQEQQELIDTDG